ncbi:MAG: hypothetical protein KJ000_29615 [Pirellulaceae bacterium]|nr:hypothetical protein [Pirellulaceae bacterium]
MIGPLDELPSNLFSHQAGPDQACLRLTPEEADEQVEAYLGRLSEALGHDGFHGGSGVHSLVFGEYGHGKTQVLYRTAHRMKSHPAALTLAVVTSAPLPGPIVEAVRRELPSGAQGRPLLDETASRLATLHADDPETARQAAVALAEVAKLNGRDHAVLLFDEAQTVVDLFEVFLAFLRELRRTFEQARVNLHTMQCHSLASLSRARELRTKLRDWLGDAVVLHLPSVLQSDAFQFFYRRALDCGVEARRAEEVVPDGIARTLCEAAGGNPRLMLIYADQVLAYAKRAGADRLCGEHVRGVFSRERGVHGGTLFMERHLKRTLDLAAEELRPDEAHVMQQALGLTDRFFGEYWRADEAELVRRFDVEAHRLRALLREVDGRRVFACEQDRELELNQYFFTPEFRTYLSGGFGSSGGFDVRQAQYGLLMAPERWQEQVVKGLAEVLRQRGRSVGPPALQLLGVFRSGHPIWAYHFETKVPGMDARVRVLVTAFYGDQPPEAALRQIREGLEQRRWLRAIVFFASERHFWDQLATQEELAAAMAMPEGDPACFRAVQREEWGPLVRPFAGVEETSPAVEAAIVFANLIDLGKRYKMQQRPGGELLDFENGILELFDAAVPTPEELCYLPNAAEMQLLDHPVWTQVPGGIALNRLSEATGQKLDGADLANLQPTLLVKQGRGYVRRPAADYPLYEALQRLLREQPRRTFTLDDLAKEVGRYVLLVGPSSRLREVVEWVAGQLENAGVANLENNTLRFVNLEHEVSEARARVRSQAAKLKTALTKLAALDEDRARPLQARHASLTELPPQTLPLREQQESLIDVEQRLRGLDADLNRVQQDVEAERRHKLDDLKKKLAELEACRTAYPDSLRLLLTSEEDFTDLRDEVQETLENAQQARAPMSLRQLKLSYAGLERRLHRQLEALRGKGKGECWERLCRAVAERHERPFREIVVTVEE